MRVGGDTTDVQLVQLIPNTAYTLSILALHGQSASDPLTEQGVTCTYRTVLFYLQMLLLMFLSVP